MGTLKVNSLTRGVELVKEGDIGIKARTVLWYLTFFGFAINYILRINASIAIVDMIDMSFKNSNSNKTIVTSECLVNGGNFSLYEDKTKYLLHETPYTSLERRFLTFFEIDYDLEGFKWDEHVQAMVLGSFFWLHWTTQLPGGVLAAKYGTKFVFGFSNFLASVICIVMPLICYLDYRWMIFLRLLQGFMTGLSMPAMHQLTGKWIPPNERSKFVSAYFGSSIGVAISYPIFGFIIKSTSWESVFHVCGFCGIIWYVMWMYFVFDSPEKHPRIHPREREYILKSLGTSVMRVGEKRTTPWKEILTSKLVWMHAFSQWGEIFSLFTLLTQAPTYFRFIHGWGIEMTGVLSGLPHLLRVVFSIGLSIVADHLLKHKKMTRNNVRNLATFFGQILNSLAVLGLAYSGCNTTAAIIFLTTSLAFHGAVSTGAIASCVDIAPNYGGFTLGIVMTFAMAAGFVSPVVVGYFTFENQTIDAWRNIFLICAAKLFICGVVYIWFNDTSIQTWNNPEVQDDNELQPMKDEKVEEKKVIGD